MKPIYLCESHLGMFREVSNETALDLYYLRKPDRSYLAQERVSVNVNETDQPILPNPQGKRHKRERPE